MSQVSEIAVSCGERWKDITRISLPEHEIMRIKSHLSGMNDDDLVHTQWFGPVGRATHGMQVVRLVIVGVDGAGRRLRRDYEDDAEQMLDNIASVYLCIMTSSDEGRPLKYVLVDGGDDDERILICRRDEFLAIFKALEKNTAKGTVWKGKREVNPEEWQEVDEDDYMFADGLVSEVHQSTGGFLRGNEAEAYAAWGMTPRRGVLLFGQPGNGKTVLSRIAAKRALAAGVNVVFLTVRSLEHGGVVTNLELATSHAPVLIVIDDLDVHCGIRSKDNDGQSVAMPRQRFLAGMLEFLDGVSSTDGYALLATTNAIDALDPALLRTGRLDCHIKVPGPADEHRNMLIKRYVALESGEAPTVNGAAAALSGCSYADLAELGRRYKIAVINHHGQQTVDQQLLDIAAAKLAQELGLRRTDESGPSFEGE